MMNKPGIPCKVIAFFEGERGSKENLLGWPEDTLIWKNKVNGKH